MKSGSIGIRALFPSKRIEGDERRRGFTLIEALVALSLVLVFAMTLEPLMYQSHRILLHGNGQVRAEILLRSLLAEPFQRAHPETGRQAGERDDLQWRLDIEPLGGESPATQASADPKKKDQHQWALYRVKAHVAWGGGRNITAETLRLGEVN